MKRYALPLFVAIYATFGIGLLFQPSPPEPNFSGGAVHLNPFTEKMVIHVSSSHAIINLDEIDLSRTEFVCDDPNAKIIVRVTGGNPTHLVGALPKNNVMLVNPAGVIVGPESVVKPGETFGASAFNLDDVLDWKKDLTFPELNNDPLIGNVVRDTDKSTSAVEVKAHGNVYALAINKEGKAIRASGSKSSSGRVFLTAPDSRKDER